MSLPSSGFLSKVTLNGNNWPIYKKKMRAQLMAYSMLNTIDTKFEKLEKLKKGGADSSSSSGPGGDAAAAKAKLREEEVELRNKAYSMILMSLDEAHTHMVMSVEEGDSFGIWSILTSHFERTTTATKAHTRRMLHTLKMVEMDSFEMYKAKVLELKMRLEGMNEVVTNGELVYVILEGLPKSYATIKQTLEVKEDATFEQICSHIRDCEEKMKYAEAQEYESAARDNEAANYAGNSRNGMNKYNRALKQQYQRGVDIGRSGSMSSSSSGNSFGIRGYPCGVCDEYGHDTYDCKDRKDRRAGQCFRCGKNEHQVRDCPDRRRKMNHGNGNGRTEQLALAWTAMAEEDSEDDDGVMF
jgi:hypothetical protein